MGCPRLTYQLKTVYRAGVAGATREEKVSRQNPWETVDTGNFYYGARYYDPKISVWLSVDPLAHKYPYISPYNFVENNPLKFIDPTGMGPEDPAGQTHVMQEGETLYGLANRTYKDLNITVEQLKLWNNLNTEEEVRNISVGTEILLYDPNGNSASAESGGNNNSDGASNEIKMETDKGKSYGIGLANKLRYSLFLNGDINPLFMAEAAFGDAGIQLVGAEFDVGGYFILAGPDAGSFVAYTEVAGGASTEGGVGIELGRIDFEGPINIFNKNALEGKRVKAWAGVGFGSTGVGVGLSRSLYKGYSIYGIGLQLGLGLGTPYVSGGANTGSVDIIE